MSESFIGGVLACDKSMNVPEKLGLLYCKVRFLMDTPRVDFILRSGDAVPVNSSIGLARELRPVLPARGPVKLTPEKWSRFRELCMMQAPEVTGIRTAPPPAALASFRAC